MLAEAGYQFEQHQPPFADPADPQTHGQADAVRLAKTLAEHKALSLWHHLADRPEPGETSEPANAGEGERIIIGADTICIDADGELVGQPSDEAEAGAMIRRFAGAQHAVVTGVAILRESQPVWPQVLADTALVDVGELSGSEIDAYVASGDWHGKAGGYNLSERQAAGWPITVTGDPTTVIGLPMRKLTDALAALGVGSAARGSLAVDHDADAGGDAAD